MINLRRVNKEALALCKRMYSARVVPLEKITLRSVKFFERAQEIRISKESLNFFSSYKDEFLTEILDHYRNVKAFTINLNFLFDDQKKDRILDKISSFALQKQIKTFQAEDVPQLSHRNLDHLTRINFLRHV